MNKGRSLLRLLTIILCFSIAGQAAAQTTTSVGVSVGNVFKYEVKYFWSSTDAGQAPPAYWVEANATDYYQATINQVIGATVTINTTQHFLNGTDFNREELVNVGNSLGGSLLVYAANLTTGSYLYPSDPNLPWKINATVSRPYGSGYRQTNWIEVKMVDVEGYVYRFTSLYFDRTTGVLVDAYFEDVFSDMPSQNFSRTVKITESSLWTVAGSPSDGDGGGDGDGQTGGLPMEVIYGVVAAVVVVAVVAVVLVLRQRGKKRQR